jgi:hypothetical protein
MKYLTVVPILMLAFTVNSAMAQHLDTTLRLVEPGGPSEESNHMGDIPAGFTSWQIVVDHSSYWTGGEIQIALTVGEIYYSIDPPPLPGFPETDNNPTGLSPVGTDYIGDPPLRFDTHASAPGYNAATGGLPIAFQQRALPGTVPASPVVREPQLFEHVWFDTPDRTEVETGMHIVGMITLSDDAEGLITGNMASVEFKGLDVVPFEFPVPIPEPSTFVLAVLGLMGLGFTRRRRA